MKRSKIFTTPKEELQKILNESKSFVEVLEKLSFNGHTGNHRTLKERLSIEEFDLSTFHKNAKKFRIEFNRKITDGLRISDESIFKEGSTYASRRQIKKKLLEKGVAYECCLCGNKGEHNGIPLSLQLDHINGINNDNRIENLRFLCPNCHSQTSTFSGKRLKK